MILQATNSADMTNSIHLSTYYRSKADELRRKAEACASRTARMWLVEAAGECELRAIRAEADLSAIPLDLVSPAAAPPPT